MNKILLKGRVSREIELRYTQTNNVAVTNFTVAVNRDFTKQGEERQADFINCVAYGKTAEFVNKYFKKGQEILVIGRLQTRTWDDQNGQKHYVTEVIVESVEFCGNKQTNDEEKYLNEERIAIQNEEYEEDDERITLLKIKKHTLAVCFFYFVKNF